VADDIMAEFQPLAETRKRMLKDVDLVIRATDVWVRIVEDAHYDVEDNKVVLSLGQREGFTALTDLLAWWCDAGPYSIGPEPICELAQWLRRFKTWRGPRRLAPVDREFFYVTGGRAFGVINRIRYSARAGVGTEPLPRVKSPGRPKGKKGKPRKKIETDLAYGLPRKDVALAHKVGIRWVSKIEKELKNNIGQMLIDGKTPADVAVQLEVPEAYVKELAHQSGPETPRIGDTFEPEMAE
jgi:hypothetical protein